MKLQELDLQQLPWWPKPWRYGLMLGLAIATGWLGYHFFLTPQWQQIKRLQLESSQLQQSLTEQYQMAAQLPLLRQQQTDLQAQLNNLLAEFSSADDTASLLDQLATLGEQHGLQTVRMEWLPRRQFRYFRELPLQLVIRGHFQQLERFVTAVSTMTPLVSVQDFRLSPFNTTPSTTSSQLQLELAAATYRPGMLEKADEANSLVLPDWLPAGQLSADPLPRDPFQFWVEQASNDSAAVTDCNKHAVADSVATPSVLPVSLDQLQLVGAMQIAGERLALVSKSDYGSNETVHFVRYNDTIGTNTGKVSKITNNYLLVDEWVPTGQGCWQRLSTRIPSRTESATPSATLSATEGDS